MRRWALPFGFLLIALGAAFYLQQLQASGRAGFPAPDFALKDLDGQTHRLADYHGKVVFLNVWATWCPPCRMEMPAMERLYHRLKRKNFAMLAVNEDEEELEAVRGFVNETGISFPVLLDPQGRVPGRYGVTGFPETFVIDQDGRVVQHTIGPEDWETERVYRYFIDLLDRSGNTTEAAGKHVQAGS